MQSYYTVATACVRDRPCVVAALGKVGLLIPVEAVAGDGGSVARVGVIHSEMQSYHRIATIRSSKRLRVVARLGVNRIIPDVAVAGGGFEKLSHRVVDGEVMRHDTVAASNSAESVGQQRVGGENGIVPSVAVADHDGVVSIDVRTEYSLKQGEPAIDHCRVFQPIKVGIVGVVGIYPSVEGFHQVGVECATDIRRSGQGPGMARSCEERQIGCVAV